VAQSILSDELLRQLIAVGQVDVLVGVPTLNSAATVGTVVRAVHQSFATDFLRERTVLINSDGGSSDGTPDVVRGASLREGETLIVPGALRTMHRISAPYHGLPGKGNALRTLFAAAELLQAKAVAVFDADVTSIEPWWLARLVRPILEGKAEFVAPVFPRHPLDGLLVTQIVRPVMRAAYGRRIREPLASEFSCSGRLASYYLAKGRWDEPLLRDGIDLWLTATTLSGGFACGEAPLGPRVQAPNPARPGLPEVFGQVVGSLFACLELHEAFWFGQHRSELAPSFGPAVDPLPEPHGLDPAPFAEAFRTGVRDLAPVLEEIFLPGTLEAVRAAAHAEGPIRYPDELWIATVYEAAAAHRRARMHREHLTRALVPLYLGRAAAFVEEQGAREGPAVEQVLDELGAAYERALPRLVEMWPPQNGR